MVFFFRKKRQKRKIQKLLETALNEMLTIVDREARMETLDQLLLESHNEQTWAQLIVGMVDYLLDTNPISSILMSYLLQNFSLHSIESSILLNKKLVKRVHKASESQKRNIAMVWSIFAEKLAGKQSLMFLTDNMLKILISFLQNDDVPVVQFHALIALEKFSMTNENKERIMKTNIIEILQNLEKQSTKNGNTSILKHQIKFCARWSLDNIFPSENRDFSMDAKKMKNVNVILNSRDSTGLLKLARHGLEVRNDSGSFESIRASCFVTEGCWYYEVTLCTAGILQIGWASRHCEFDSEEGTGTGDDSNSIAYDGCRRRIWHRGISEEYGSSRWTAGDVVGIYLDIDEEVLSFSLNGEDFGNALEKFSSPPDLKELASNHFFPAASFMTHQHCIFNFGHAPFKFPPSKKFKTLNSILKLSDEDKFVTPKLLKSVVSEEFDDDRPICEICCDRNPNSMLLPCEHRGFCFRCALQVEICPICRTYIENRKIVSVVFSNNASNNNSFEGKMLSTQVNLDGEIELLEPPDNIPQFKKGKEKEIYSMNQIY